MKHFVDPFDLECGEYVIDESPECAHSHAPLHERRRLEADVRVREERLGVRKRAERLRGRTMVSVIRVDQRVQRGCVDERGQSPSPSSKAES